MFQAHVAERIPLSLAAPAELPGTVVMLL